MSNIADYWGELPPNLNGLQEWGHGQGVVGAGYTRLMLGKVVGYPHMESHHISSTYNVSLTDMHDDHGGEIIIHNCSQVLPNAGLDYSGVREPLMDGTPVLILCKDGVFDQGYIIGCVRLSGDYESFLLQGNVPKPFNVVEGWQERERTANPGPSFPYVIARPEDYVRITPMDNLVAGYARPEYEKEEKGKAKKRPQPGSVEIRTMGGDIVYYTKNTFSIYADRQVVILALSGNETKCTALAQHASYYAERYEALKAAIESAPTKDDKGTMSNWNTGKPVGYTKDLSQTDRTSLDWGEPMGVKYHLDELYKLAQEYRKASAACNSASAALSKGIANTEKKAQGNTPPNSKDKGKAPDQSKPANKAIPKESVTGTPPQSNRASIEVDELLQKLGDKAPDAMTIQKVGESSPWSEKGDTPLPMAFTVKLQVIDLVVNSKVKLPASITITKDVLGEGEKAMLGKSYSVEQLVNMTLKDSSNVATNALIKAIAGEGGNGIINPAIQGLLRDRGYGNTNLTNYLNTIVTSAHGKNTSTTNDVTKAMSNLMEYDGPLKQVIRDSLGASDTPFQGNRIVDGIPVIYNKIGGTTTNAANSAVIEVDGSKYIVTTTKGSVDGTSGQGDAISDAALREAIKQIKGLGNMGGPSNATPTVNIKGGLQSI